MLSSNSTKESKRQPLFWLIILLHNLSPFSDYSSWVFFFSLPSPSLPLPPNTASSPARWPANCLLNPSLRELFQIKTSHLLSGLLQGIYPSLLLSCSSSFFKEEEDLNTILIMPTPPFLPSPPPPHTCSKTLNHFSFLRIKSNI